MRLLVPAARALRLLLSVAAAAPQGRTLDLAEEIFAGFVGVRGGFGDRCRTCGSETFWVYMQTGSSSGSRC